VRRRRCRGPSGEVDSARPAATGRRDHLGTGCRVGLTRSAIHTRVRTGRWERLGPRVYLSLDREYTDRVRLRAAVYSAGAGAAAHGASAAWWHSLTDTLPAVVDVTVPRGRGPQQQAGVRLRRRNLAPQDRVHFRELWVTGLPLTVLEAAAVMRDGVNLLDRALQRRVRLATLPFPRSGSPWRWTAGLYTSTRLASRPTGCGRTSSSTAVGGCCASRGTSSPTGLTPSSPTSGRRFRKNLSLPAIRILTNVFLPEVLSRVSATAGSATARAPRQAASAAPRPAPGW